MFEIICNYDDKKMAQKLEKLLILLMDNTGYEREEVFIDDENMPEIKGRMTIVYKKVGD